MKKLLYTAAIVALMTSCASSQPEADSLPSQTFPFFIPKEKPAFKLSKAMERVYDHFKSSKPDLNELYTLFKYTEIDGLDYNDHDGTITRRDPSRIVKANGKYYMWYTLRNTPTTFLGADLATETIPSADWDLSDIGYATSVDGFTWEEQGIAVPRPPKPEPGWRSVSTPDVLYWKGKYYLYYQAFSEISGRRGDDCPVAVSWSDSPDGPWTAVNQVVVPNGAEGTWDQYSIHDPHPIVYKGKIYLYYKSDYNGQGDLVRSQGLAVAEDPLGPFVKHPQNPVISSGHETQMFRFKEGIAAVLTKDGHEFNTIQYSPNGIDFDMVSICEMPPLAAGFYDPEAFTDVDYADGVTWGVSHFNFQDETGHSVLLRFDCDLSLENHDPLMKANIRLFFKYDEYLRRGLTKEQKSAILERESL